MQLSLNKYRIGAFASALLLLAALPSHAQFGGVVFDPTQSAHALQQIEQNIQNSVTWQQQLANTIQLLATADKDYQQAITTYNMIHGNLQNFSSKSIWRTIQSQLTMASFANQYGETTGLQAAMNGQATESSLSLLPSSSTWRWFQPSRRPCLAGGSGAAGRVMQFAETLVMRAAMIAAV